MTVKEAIEALSKFDPEAVLVGFDEGHDLFYEKDTIRIVSQEEIDRTQYTDEDLATWPLVYMN